MPTNGVTICCTDINARRHFEPVCLLAQQSALALNLTKLRRLADRVGRDYGTSSAGSPKFVEVCEALGLEEEETMDEAVSIDEEAFAAACRANAQGTVLGTRRSGRSGGWFEKLELELVEERGWLASLCAACGF